MATKVKVIVTINGTRTFAASPGGFIRFADNSLQYFDLTTLEATPPKTRSTGPTPIVLTTPILPGSRDFTFEFSAISPQIAGTNVATFTLIFYNASNTIVGTNSTPKSLRIAVDGDPAIGTVTITIACLHGSSLISMKEGMKRLDQIKAGDEVLTGNNLDQYMMQLSLNPILYLNSNQLKN